MHDEALLNRVREALMDVPDVEEKRMFGGTCFMVDDKMCICMRAEQLMCRVSPTTYEHSIEEPGVGPMIHGGRNMKGYLYVRDEAIATTKGFNRWINECLEFNKMAKSSKRK